MKAVAAIVVLATLAAPAAGAGPEDQVAELEEQLLLEVEQARAASGLYSTELVDALRALVLLYAENGEHVRALVAIEEALQAIRMNRGLYSLDQVPLLFQRIYAEEARGNDAEVWTLEQELLTLLRRHPDDLRTVPAMREMADRQMAVLDRVMAGERHPNIVHGCFYKRWPADEGGSCLAGSRQQVVQGMFAEAQRNYSAAITTLLRNGMETGAEARELEMQILHGVERVRSAYAENHSRVGTPMPLVPSFLGSGSIEPWRGRMAPVVALAGWEGLPYPSMGSLDSAEPKDETKHVRIMDPYHRGRQSLRRLYAYDAADPASTPLSRAAAALQIADWDLLFSRYGEAVDRYALTYAMLQQAGVSKASIDEILSPATPVVLPAFEPNPLARDESRPAIGHIDVALDITRYGRARDPRIVDEVNAPHEAKRELVGFISKSRFRPRPRDGQFGDTSHVVVRYYLTAANAE